MSLDTRPPSPSETVQRWREYLRYPRLYLGFARYCLIREMSFRVNFIARCIAEVAWLAVLVMFFHLIYLKTGRIGDWNQYEYLFFLGTGFILNGLVDMLFIDNFTNMSELIRTGNLDFALLKPIDEQFLLSCQRIDWAVLPNLLLGAALLVVSCVNTGTAITPDRVIVYMVLMSAGLAILYSLMLVMAGSSVWFVRNTGLYEAWFYVTQFSRYPAEIYGGNPLGLVLHFSLTFLLPILLAVNVPARYGMNMVSWPLAVYLLFAAAVALFSSRVFFSSRSNPIVAPAASVLWAALGKV
ncbi:MAG: ABC-2 family transporter protein [Planctomycetota bacterium]